MTDPLEPFVARRGAAVLDGGLASELERRGIDIGGRLWSAEALASRPDALMEIHRDYLAAGADVITTATYQATIEAFVADRADESRARRLVRSGVELARSAREAHVATSSRGGAELLSPLIAASIGSYGAFLADGSEYRGDYGLGAARLAEWHRPRLRLLEDAGPDLIAFETIPSLEEARAIATLLTEREGPAAWVSFATEGNGQIAEGAPIAEAFASLERVARVVAVGFNCAPPENIAPLLASARNLTAKRLVAYPNAGDRWDPAGRRWVDRRTRADFRSLAATWRGAGASLIGGCCRTTPRDIADIALALGS